MPKNEQRREAIVDAGLTVLARVGSRGLTHRAIDGELGLPQGTCVNYLRTREALLQALGERIYERLTPDESSRDKSASRRPSRKRVAELMHELLDRVLAEPELQIAFLELRLEAVRRPGLERTLTQTVKGSLDLDLEFHASAGLPGGPTEVTLLHLAMEGLILNTVTLPDALGLADRSVWVDEIVTRIMP